jgi:glycosyltransferase involved in cell wall biosynthesis
VVASGESDTVAAITRQRAVFLRLVAHGAWELRRGRAETAAAYAQIAANYAWHNHPGLFASPSLEALLRSLARTLTSPVPARPRTAGILHVLTTGLRVGGHTRLVWQWIRNDPQRRHSVVLTGQSGLNRKPIDVPRQLVDAARGSGGEVVAMNDRDDGVLTRAAALRELAAGFELIVLHIHPYDAIPLVALDVDGRPPVIFLNHAEHVFWAGATAGDVVAHLREESAEVAEQFRGIERTRSFVLPVPLSRTKVPSREDARRSLGLSDDAVVLLTVGTEYKYATRDGRHFVDALLPVLERNERAVLVAIGPRDEGPWERAKAGGRVRAFGRRDDVGVFLAASDVYLDSFPIGSLTAVLEAALAGLPIVQCELPTPTLLPTTDAALTGHMIRAPLADYGDRISALIEDAASRQAIGAATQKRVLELHTGETWRSMVERLYAEAAQPRSGWPTLELDEARPVAPIDGWVQWMNETTNYSRYFSEAQLIAHTRFMPMDRRLVLAARTRGLAKLVQPIDIRTRGHLERPRRYVAADAVEPADWPVFMKAVLGAARRAPELRG